MAGADLLLVMTTLPDCTAATAVARALVERRLAACVSIQAPCVSIYRWQGAVAQATEVSLLIKTTRARYPALQAALREMHPYELPEIVALEAADGLPAYLDWIRMETLDDDAGRIDDDQ